MCKTNTSIVYGILVKNWSLYIAAKAHEKLYPALVVFEIITMRFKNGTLGSHEAESSALAPSSDLAAPAGVTRSGGMPLLPLEIYDLIRLQLIDLVLESVEATQLESFQCRCIECQEIKQLKDANVGIDERTESAHHIYVRGKGQNTIYGFEVHLDGMCALYHTLTFDLIGRDYNRVKRFLSHFGLDSDCGSSPFTPNDLLDFTKLVTPISIPICATSSSSSTASNLPACSTASTISSNNHCSISSLASIESKIDHDSAGAAESASATVLSPELFSDALQLNTSRFQRLVRDYRLDLPDPMKSGSIPATSLRRRSSESKEESLSIPSISKPVDEERRLSRVDPKWIIWTTNISCIRLVAA